MSTMIFVNLPTADLARSDAFYGAMGYEKNTTFSDKNASSWIVEENILIMVLRAEFFASFLVDGDVPALGSEHRETLNALSAATRDAVEDFVTRAVAGGGSVYRPADEPFPGMYQAAVKDPDGHVWEIAWMSPEAMTNPGA